MIAHENLQPNPRSQEIQHKCPFHNYNGPQEDALHKTCSAPLQENTNKALGISKTGLKKIQNTRLPTELKSDQSKKTSASSCLKNILVY